MSQLIRVRLLGTFAVFGPDGGQVDMPGKKIQALGGYLAAEYRRSHPREELATLLWGDTGDERARHNLRQALAKVRRACEALVISEGEALQINREECAIDVEEFERLLGQDEAESLGAGLDLFQHELLDGLAVTEPAFEEWLRNRRTGLRERACDGYERLANSLVEKGLVEQPIEVLRRQLSLDPACERAHVGLMELFAGAGRRAEALRQYQKCVEALDRELGVRPSADTETAYQRIRQGETETEKPIARGRAVEPPRPVDPPSVAVLPFENLSGEDQRYFADGIAEDIIGALSRFGSLLVIARESSFACRDRTLTIPEIGRKLGAQFIVSGSVRLSGSQVRLSVQLLDASTGQHFWAERFDRKLEDVFAVQDEITEVVVGTLAGRVEAARLARARRIPAERLDAYDFVLRGKEYHHRVTEEDCDRALEMFERAIERDSSYALGHAWLACGLGQAMIFHPERSEELRNRAEEVVKRGLALDDNESECYRILAQIALQRRDLDSAISYQERALALNPNDDRSVCAMGTMLTLSGNPEDGERWIRKAMRTNPYHPESVWFHLARALFHVRRDEDALSALRNITQPRPRELVYRVASLSRLGDADATAEAVLALQKATPGFVPENFVASIPFRQELDRTVLLETLRAAGL